jgi:hypothetical protein
MRINDAAFIGSQNKLSDSTYENSRPALIKISVCGQ